MPDKYKRRPWVVVPGVGGEELGSIESPGIDAIPVLQAGLALLDLQTFIPLVRRDGMWISPLLLVTRHRATLSGTDGRLGGFQRVKISGTEHCAKCPCSLSGGVGLAGRGHDTAPPLPPQRSSSVIVCLAQASGFESHHHIGGVVATRHLPVDSFVRSTPIAGAGLPLSVQELLTEP